MDQTDVLSYVTSVAGLAALVAIVEEVIVRAAGAGFDTDRFGPLLALGLGIVAAVAGQVAVGIVSGAGVVGAIVTGILAGSAAMAGHDTVTSLAPATG